MDRHDQELLDKQLQKITPLPRHDGVMILGILTVFFVGMTIGGFTFAYKSAPLRFAANNTTLALPLQNHSSPVMRQ